MSKIEFYEDDVERVIIAANDILGKDILPLLKDDKSIKACFLLEKLIVNLATCQAEMAYQVRKLNIAEFFIEWKYQIKLLSQTMTEMKNEDIIFELEIIMATCRKNIEPQSLFVS